MPAQILHQVSTFHSSYAIDHSEAPAPMLIANGWTDDLFPGDEALRYYNRTTTQYPHTPLSLFFGDWGHPRAQNKTADLARYVAAIHRWLDYYVRGRGHRPFQRGCRRSPRHARARLPRPAPTGRRPGRSLSPARSGSTRPARRRSCPPRRGIRPSIRWERRPAPRPRAPRIPGAATYRLPVAHAFTMIGSATVVADFTLPGSTSQVAARLLDVGPDGQETLISRGLWRPAVSATPRRQVFQLHPGGWRFAAGHTVKLELLPNDVPYGRASNGQRT